MIHEVFILAEDGTISGDFCLSEALDLFDPFMRDDARGMLRCHKENQGAAHALFRCNRFGMSPMHYSR